MLCLLLSFVQGLAATPHQETVTNAIEQTGTPAMAMMSWKNGVVVDEVALGRASSASTQKVSDKSKWHLGSNGMLFTATLAARLVDKGAISWSTTVGELFPKAKKEWREVTLAQLLRHTGGATKDIGHERKELWKLVWDKRAERPQRVRQEFAKELVGDKPSNSPGEYVFSRAGYVLAGAMLEIAAKDTFEKLMVKEVFSPLSIKTCGFGPLDLPEPMGHKGSKGAYVSVKAKIGMADLPPSLSPSGTIHCSLHGWTKLLAMHVSTPDVFLKADTWKELHDSKGGSVAPGMLITAVSNKRAYQQTGSNGFNTATMVMVPEKGAVVLVVMNASIPSWTRQLATTAMADLIR